MIFNTFNILLAGKLERVQRQQQQLLLPVIKSLLRQSTKWHYTKVIFVLITALPFFFAFTFPVNLLTEATRRIGITMMILMMTIGMTRMRMTIFMMTGMMMR